MKLDFLWRWWFGPLPKPHRCWLRKARPYKGLCLLRFVILQVFYHPPKRWMVKIWLVLLRRFFGLKVVALTGTAGKTTTKEMIASLLATQYRVVASRENIDPIYNIASSILKCRPSTQYLVLEMGVEYPGEMAFYLWLTGAPEIGVFTNVGSAHTEFFGSVQGVLEEKGQLLKVLPPEATAIIGSDDPRLKSLVGSLSSISMSFGLSSADLQADEIVLTPDFQTRFCLSGFSQEKLTLTLPLLGCHFVQNALASLAVAKVVGVSQSHLQEGLNQIKPSPHRLMPIRLTSGTVVLDDTYNSNPLAAQASLSVLVDSASGRRTIAVLGEMKELGDLSTEGHQQVGQKAGELGINVVIGFMYATKPLVESARRSGVSEVYLLESKDEVVAKLRKMMTGKEVILIKGSRALGMEDIVEGMRYLK